MRVSCVAVELQTNHDLRRPRSEPEEPCKREGSTRSALGNATHVASTTKVSQPFRSSSHSSKSQNRNESPSSHQFILRTGLLWGICHSYADRPMDGLQSPLLPNHQVMRKYVKLDGVARFSPSLPKIQDAPRKYEWHVFDSFRPFTMLKRILILVLAAAPNSVFAMNRRQVDARPSPCLIPSISYSTFSYSLVTSNLYADTPSKTCGKDHIPPSIRAAFSLLPKSVTYTTYSINPAATPPGKYCELAYNGLWSPLKYSQSALPFSTTVLPTPVPTSELVFSPALYQSTPG